MKDKKSYTILQVSLVISILLIIFSLLSKPIHYEDDGNLYDLSIGEEKVSISFNKDLTNIESFKTKGDNGRENIFIEAYTSRLDEILNKSSKEIISFDKNTYNIYYDNQDKKAGLIYGDPKENIERKPSLIFNHYFFIISAICLSYIFISVGYKKYRKFNIYLIFLPLTYLLSYMLVSGFKFYSFYPKRDAFYINLLWLGLYLLIFSLIKIYKEKKTNEI